ncbi:MAG: gliding motility-associated C-terminal domain-containing protein [Bacteroidetes bacterium]|nr:gliding motility-associated C-terminal domain-containing protein [Bacteroidota bacterium]
MKGYIKQLKGMLAMLALLVFSGSAYSQCTIQWDGSPCINSPIQFTGASVGTTHDWDFGDGNTTTGTYLPKYPYKAAGNYKVRYITTINGSKCTATLDLTIKASPKPRLRLKSIKEQCFEKNLFCFDDSSANPNGAKIANIKYVISDGQLFEFKNPGMPQVFCFSVKDQRGGCFDMYVEYTDENGCTAIDTGKCAVKVREKIGAAFTSNKPVKCDSVTAVIKNISRISSSQVKSIIWYWGDGTTSTTWGPNITHTYKGQGTYKAKMVIETIDGCKDSFSLDATATVFKSNANILANKDSTCISDPKIDFRVDEIPSGATGFLWNFGDPPTGPQNFDNKTWAPSHSFSGLGPYQIKLTYSHPICGNRISYDTIIILGPSSTIEIPFNRLAEFEVFQCPKDVQDSVHFKNFSKFYHNDKDYTNDDSTFYKKDGSLGHVFDNAQTWVKPKGKDPQGKYSGFVDKFFRQRVCATRLWDFGDQYAPKCTTDILENKNVNTNCQYSRDSLPTHYYKSWDLVLLDKFKNAPMEDAIFIDSNRLCKKINVWPSDSFYVIQDTFITIPKNGADSASGADPKYSKIKTKFYLREKIVTGPGERFITDYVDIQLNAGDSAWVGPEKGPYILQKGKKTISLKPNDIVKLKSKTDTVRYLFTIYLKPDTLPVPLLRIRQKKGENPKIVSFFKRTPPGIAGFDYMINYQRFRDLYYAKIPQCNNVKLFHEDTCHPLHCTSEATKQLAMMHANAGGVGSGLVKDAIECLGGKSPSYGITFILSDLKPGCTFSHVAINFDSTCDPKAFVPLSGLSPGNRPPGPPYPGYQLAGNPPSRYSKQYNASEVCDPSGCITVGIIVGNGVDKATGNRPLCADTQWYRRFACFPLIDPSFEVVRPKPNAVLNRKVCRGDSIIVRPIGANKTRNRDLKTLRWELATGNASPSYSRGWRRFVQEDYFYGQRIKDSTPTRIYNYWVVSRGGEDPVQVPCTDIWNDGNTKLTKKPDTLVTAIISKWDTAADVSAVWDNIKERLKARGFDPFAVDGVTLAKMIWNNKGIIGNPSSGARGCIDTNGFGRFIKFYLNPDPKFTKIIHPRDTSIRPIDSFKQGNKWLKGYTFFPKWAGYHLVSISMTSSNGKCDEFAAYPVIVGFAMMLELPDSIVCQDQANTLQARPDYRMFHPDPINFGTWDPTDYWRDPARQAKAGQKNVEGFTKWDWSKADDDITKPQTIFGGAPYGGNGVGTVANPWVQLGGGGMTALYYKNDSGVYIFRNSASDSTGCKDTIEKKVFITRLDAKFGLGLNTPSCNSIIEFTDSTMLFDPCSWARKNCAGPTPIECDFITEWYINWGDGKNNEFKRATSKEGGLPARIGHKYSRNGWFNIQYRVRTKEGCQDTISQWVKIPGPRPKFEYTDKAGTEVTICAGDSIQFTNLTDSASSSAAWFWRFGDGKIANTSIKNLWHTYPDAGKYYIFLEQYDSLIVPPNIRRFCPATFPDTAGGQAAFIVTVWPRDSVRGKIEKVAICAGDENVFIDFSDTIFKSNKWIFKNLSTGAVDSFTTTSDTFRHKFDVHGTYEVTHLVDYDPNKPRPWCPTLMKKLSFLVDSVIAGFDIDSSNKPDFSFTRTDINGVTFRWGFGHRNDITVGPQKDFIEHLKSNDKTVKWSYDSSNVYWVCQIATNATGCSDTICKPVTVDLFIYLANVFTPGDDGKNDTYRVPIQGQDLYDMKIFNRWGERVFHSEDAKYQWNGKVNNNGPECPEGTYFYQFTYRFKGKKEKTVSGSVNLIRGN